MANASNEIPKPRQQRAIKTVEKLIATTGQLLDEVGFERISTNLIAERAGVSPPTLYRYFKDKYDILGAFGRFVMEAQNELLADIGESLQTDPDFVLTSALLTQLNMDTVRVTEEIPGGVQIMKCLRVVPELMDIRTESHHEMSVALAKAATVFRPDLTEEEIYQQTRFSIELGYTAIEYALENTTVDRMATMVDVSKAIAAFNSVVQLSSD